MNRLLSVALFWMIIVGAVLVSLKLAVDGAYTPAFALVLALGVFAFIRYTDSTLLR